MNVCTRTPKLTDPVEQLAGRERSIPGDDDAAHARSGGGELGKRRRRRSCRRADALGDAGDQRDATTIAVRTTHLDPQRADAAFGMWRAEHRQPSSEAVTPRRRHAGTDPRRRGKRRLQRDRIDQLGPVTVIRTDGLGKPAQLAAAAAGPLDPLAVDPSCRLRAEGVVVLAGARRTSGAVHGDVDLVDRVERFGQPTSDEAGQPGSHAGADGDRDAVLASELVELEQLPQLAHVTDGRHDMHTRPDEIGDEITVRQRVRQHHRSAAAEPVDRVDDGDVVVSLGQGPRSLQSTANGPRAVPCRRACVRLENRRRRRRRCRRVAWGQSAGRAGVEVSTGCHPPC